ncbi:MAG: hypothetical protein JRF50_12895 [Deltaproteobacteria bacterium]|nr:hypothetical protein [Deltaproteobacteria bacterium]
MSIPFPACIGCEQGMENQLLEESSDALLGAPKRGKGERDINCEHYGACLDLADSKNWKSFNCESCPLYHPASKKALPAPEKKENTRICEECGERPTIQPSTAFCASCLGKKAHRGDKPKKAAHKRPKKKRGSLDKAKPETGRQEANISLTIKFSKKYIWILREIEKLADEEVRMVEEQAIYILKSGLSGIDDRKASDTRP